MRLALRRIGHLVRKELRQLFRDPRMARVIFVAPAVQLVVFGYAVNTDVRGTPVLLLDRDRTAASRALVQSLTASGYFRIVGEVGRPGELARALDRGEATLALEISRGFARDLARGREPAVQILVDGTSSNTANVAQGHAARLVTEFGLRRPGRAVESPVDFRPRVWYNPTLASRVYNVPAVAGVIIMLMCLMLTALSVVREREMGTLEQLMVSPLRPAELVIGKTIPVALVALADLVLVTAIAVLWFGIPLKGSPLLLVGASLPYILAGLGTGLLISGVSNTQQEAYMTMFLVFLPAMLLSGFMFPVSSMPAVFQWITLVNPIRHFLEVVRGVFLKGVGLEVLWPQVLALTGMAAALLWAATRRFGATRH